MVNKTLFAEHIRSLKPIPTGLQPRGGLTSPVACILFDVYGTLFISESGDIGLARHRLPSARNLPALLEKYAVDRPVDALLNAFFLQIRETHRTLHEKGVDYPEVEIDRIWMQVLKNDDMDAVRRFALEFEFLVNPVYPMPHLNTLLQACAQIRMPLGIISNAQFYTPMLFEIFFESDLHQMGFQNDLVFFSYRYGRAKPSRYLYEQAAAGIRKRGIPPAHVLYVGNDMRNDIDPAARIGFKTALFAGDRRSLRLREEDPRLKTQAPDLIVTDLIQLLAYVKD